MNIHLSKQLLHWNSLYQQLNETYRQYATQKGVSETTLWLLYFLCEQGGSCEQRALCRSLLDPPQTVNSSLKKLEQQGLISLKLVAGSRKNKEVSLTERRTVRKNNRTSPDGGRTAVFFRSVRTGTTANANADAETSGLAADGVGTSSMH